MNVSIKESLKSGHANESFERINPYTSEVASVSPAASVDDAVQVVEAAQAAFPEWAALGPHSRREILLKAVDQLEARNADIVAANMAETGATEAWILFNISVGVKILREAASMTTQMGGEVIPSEKPGVLAMGIRQPAGVCVGIAPWNAAVILGLRAVAMPLACGNTVILKASEMCPKTHQILGEVLNAAGLPKGVMNVITNAPKDAPDIVENLIRHPAVKRVNFTGSTRVGKVIAKICAEELKPCLLELGGKAPFIVLDDADINAAVNSATFGAYINMGQICMSTERFIVTEGIADAFAEALAKKAASLPAGDPAGPNVLGPVVSSESAEKLKELMDDAVSKGANIIAGGDIQGTVVPATLIDNVTPAMRIYSEESFGPVKSIIRVKDAKEAIQVANESQYGLSSAIYTQDVRKGMALAAQVECGICHINGPNRFR